MTPPVYLKSWDFCNFMDTHGELLIINLNVGGTRFQCYRHTLDTFPDSKLANLNLQSTYYNAEKNEFFFDRNPVLFQCILDAFRKGVIHMPRDICGSTFKEELLYWKIPSRRMAPCCWEALYRCENDLNTMKTLVHDLRKGRQVMASLEVQSPWKHKIWQFLEDHNSSRAAMVSSWVTVYFYLQHTL